MSSPKPLVVLAAESGHEPAAASRTRPAPEDVDENGDVIFRFKLRRLPDAGGLTLQEIYRQSIHDLLQLVRFYSRGEPVVVDGFAFLNDPQKRINILPPKPEH